MNMVKEHGLDMVKVNKAHTHSVSVTEAPVLVLQQHTMCYKAVRYPAPM